MASALPVAAFDARVWLASYEQAGGDYVVTAAGNLVFLTSFIDGLSLTQAMAQIVGNADRLSAVREIAEARHG